MAAQLTVLVVEDDTSMRRAIGRLLEAAGYAALVFGSAEALVDSAEQLSAACVVTDIHLPAMSGFELVDVLRQHTSRLPVVFITAFDKQEIRMKASAYAGACYLPKPFEGNDLLEAIGRATHSEH